MPWLSPLEQQLLRTIACDRPRHADAFVSALAPAPPEAVRCACDELQRIKLVDFEGQRDHVTIPLLAKWVAERFGGTGVETAPQSARQFRWAVGGLLGSVALVGAHGFLSSGPTITRSSTGPGCSFVVVHPTASIPSKEFSLQVLLDPCTNPPTALSLKPATGTMLRVAGKFAAAMSIAISNGGGEMKLVLDKGPELGITDSSSRETARSARCCTSAPTGWVSCRTGRQP